MKLFGAAAISVGVLIASSGVGNAEDALVVYTPQSQDRMQVLQDMAEHALGFPIKFVYLGGGAVYDRVLAERNNPQADVVYGMINPLMAGLKKEGLLLKYNPKSAEGLPDIYKDPDGYFYAYRQTPITLSYNADILKPDQVIHDWLDLGKPELKGKFTMGPLTWQTSRAILAGLFTRFLDKNGDVTKEGWDWFKRFYDNAVLINSGDPRPQMIASGKTPYSLNHFQGVQDDAKAGGYHYAYINTVGGTPVVTESNGIIKGTKKFDKALAFIEFASSPEFQIGNAERFGVLPIHPDAIKYVSKKIRDEATLLTPQKINWDLMAEKLDKWIARIQLDYL